MFERINYISLLIGKRLRDEPLTAEQEMYMNDWINAHARNKELYEVLYNDEWLKSEVAQYMLMDGDKDSAHEQAYGMVFPQQNIATAFRPRFWYKYLVAASVIALAGLCTLYYFNTGAGKIQTTTTTVTEKPKQDIPPGGNKAMLTLADGSVIVLDSANQGVIARQGETVIDKKQDGQLVYSDAHPRPRGAGRSAIGISYNTVSTPRGGQYQLILPDGSKVWLNADSRLKFATAFVNERRVELSGEGYFEVRASTLLSTGKKLPFIVAIVDKTGDSKGEILVTGTQFNVSAYSDELMIRTTLLEGKVQVSAAQPGTSNPKPETLLVGEQASWNGSSSIRKTKIEDASTSIAWVNGIFHFEKATIPEVMRQLARWYNIEVLITGNISGATITGDVERDIPLSELLSNLSKVTSVRFTTQGRVVTVAP